MAIFTNPQQLEPSTEGPVFTPVTVFTVIRGQRVSVSSAVSIWDDVAHCQATITHSRPAG